MMVSDRFHDLGNLLDKKTKTTVGFQQSLQNFVLVHFHLSIIPSQMPDANKQATVNSNRMDRVVAKWLEVDFPGSIRRMKTRMGTDALRSDTTDVIEVLNVGNPDDGLFCSTRKLQASSTSQSK